MIWYLLIFTGIFATLLAYRKKYTISRMGIEETNLLERFFGTDCGVTTCALVTMLVVLAFILKADPTIPQLKAKQYEIELVKYTMIGEKLGKRVGAQAKKGKALIIARRPNEEAKPYHDACLAAMKSGFDGKLEVGHIELLEVFKGETETHELERPFRISNTQIDNLVQQNPDCTAIVSLVGVEETFIETKLAISVHKGQKAFAVYSDNLYMSGKALANGCISYLIAPKPTFDPKAQIYNADATAPDFSTAFLEVDKKNIYEVAKRHKRMLYVTTRAEKPKEK